MGKPGRQAEAWRRPSLERGPLLRCVRIERRAQLRVGGRQLGVRQQLLLRQGAHCAGAGNLPEAEGTAVAEVNENLKPYKAGRTHRHIPEMERNLGRILAQGRRVRTHGEARAVRLSFTPHLVPMTRGILVTAEAEVEGAWSQESLEALYRDFYAGEPFVRVLKGLPETKATLGSNRVDVRPLYEERTGRVLVFAALDNLVKGMAGQAVQNLNLMLGLPEETALPKEGLWP